MRDADWYDKWCERFLILAVSIFGAGALLNLIVMVLALTH